MSKKIVTLPSKIKQYWKRLMSSSRENFSRGSSHICRMISWARNESWRQSDRKTRKQPKK